MEWNGVQLVRGFGSIRGGASGVRYRGRGGRYTGTDLTGATSVSFNGRPASFVVRAGSAIAATVPAGATSGTIQVVRPDGTRSSNAPFLVLP